MNSKNLPFLFFVFFVSLSAQDGVGKNNAVDGDEHHHHYHGTVVQNFHHQITSQNLQGFDQTQGAQTQGAQTQGAQTQLLSSENQLNAQLRIDYVSHIIQETYQNLSAKCEKSAQSFFAWVDENKLSLTCSTAGVTLFSGYAYLQYRLFVAHQKLYHVHSWSSWKNNATVDEWLLMSQADLEKELLFAFQQRYIDPVNPTNALYSMIQSLKALDQEIAVAEYLVDSYEWILKCRVERLFGVTYEKYVDVQSRLRKLRFMKHIFVSWCAWYKIDQM
jgi:hypothetical protein